MTICQLFANRSRLWFSKINKYCTSRKNYDVVIIGGGMVGQAMACCIGTNPVLKALSVLLVDVGKPVQYEMSKHYSNRVCAISPRSVSLFEKMDCWSDMKNNRVQPVLRMIVWEDCSNAHVTFENPTSDSEKPLAYIIENDLMLSSFFKRISSSSNVTFKSETTVKSVKLADSLSDLVTVHFGDSSTVTAKLLIAADGSNSRIRSAMGVRTLQWNYDQKSIVANLKLIYSNPEDSCTAWQRFIRTGPLAVLPLSSDQASLSWSSDDQFASKLMDMSETEFVDSLNRALCDQSSQNVVTNSTLDLMDTFFENNRLSAIVPPTVVGVEKRFAIPLSLVQPAHYVDHRVALIGDSAHRIHPLAGQGVNLGYADVEELANVIESAMMAGCDIGSMLHLREYETRRQREVIPIAFGCDALNKLYKYKFSPIVLARSLGVNFIEKSPFLKVRLHQKRTFTNIVSRPKISI
ncbi:Ubiquinone biosynthesis monooxygenase COQ6 [Trichinella pseudospiralis]|uniref:Ubiquinone biosynthesis monooxygenase COQ6, mitochondrial n=2 Tax=Trichinella pseudospiralis TaxID=6337 RepID=A0A0V0XT18_TRIPS|nr:Ubiquinone biosynthesis monooxygenase COQ6 [Trichinella pseudospiralis]